MEAWKDCSSLFEWSKDEEVELLDSQLIQKKEENYAFGSLKGIYPQADVSKELQKKFGELMRRRQLGILEHAYSAVSRDIHKRQFIDKVKTKIKNFIR